VTAQTITDIAHGWPTIDTAPIQPDARPILCRGYRCQCRGFARWRTVAGYTECECGHSEQTHRTPDQSQTKQAKRGRR
jgi:hypothetical protein